MYRVEKDFKVRRIFLRSNGFGTYGKILKGKKYFAVHIEESAWLTHKFVVHREKAHNTTKFLKIMIFVLFGVGNGEKNTLSCARGG
jgi:hypothetical protein